MNENWRCAAYGCPLAGSMGTGEKWYCFCHYGKASETNDRITRVLQDMDFIAQSVLDIRGGQSSPEWPVILRNIEARLVRGGREDLLMGDMDSSPCRPNQPVTNIWLMRLERVLIDACQTRGAVIGATKAAEHYSETEAMA